MSEVLFCLLLQFSICGRVISCVVDWALKLWSVEILVQTSFGTVKHFTFLQKSNFISTVYPHKQSSLFVHLQHLLLSVLTLCALSCCFSISTRYYSSEDGSRCYHWSSGRNDPAHRHDSQCPRGEVVIFNCMILWFCDNFLGKMQEKVTSILVRIQQGLYTDMAY